MLFNSYAFIFAFLPVVVAVYYALGRRHASLTAWWLVAASLFFYGWWSPRHLWLLVGSIVFNYAAGLALARLQAPRGRRLVLTAAVAANLALLSYYKYANFLLDTLERLGGPSHHIANLVLPIGISFFTFTQIAFLVDAFQRKAAEYKFSHYALFVLYFPHLIAGPILHHGEMMPQFRSGEAHRLPAENLSVGLTVFAMGLFKKVVIADGIAVYVEPVFGSSGSLTTVDAWCGVLAYTFQLYFDFSGYSDMAIGISRMLGIRLPVNFYSPYKATSIVEFWRRWHMTLSRFLRDYLYVPLGGNRKGKARRYMNLMITMMLGGLWHGASWTFVAWGALHGIYLVINHAWRALRRKAAPAGREGATWGARIAGGGLTFLAVVVAWVFFRAESFESALRILAAMSGLHSGGFAPAVADAARFAWLGLLLAFVWLLPNTLQIMERFDPALPTAVHAEIPRALALLRWRPNWAWAIAFCGVALASILLISRESVFLYYQF